MVARGTFEVRTAVQTPDGERQAGGPERISLEKRFHGDLEGAGSGEMLAASTPVSGSAGYVAIEKVNGTLHGRRGSFLLQHSGIMTRGTPRLTIVVVPDSGTGELEHLAGTMSITISGGKHSYEFEYLLTPSERGLAI